MSVRTREISGLQRSTFAVRREMRLLVCVRARVEDDVSRHETSELVMGL